jgi:segregation and condensation protein B
MNHTSAIECLLFVAEGPLSLKDVACALQCDELDAEAALRNLQQRLEESGSGLQLMAIAGGYQLTTRPEYAEVIGRLKMRSPTKLSHAALETLAIIAYRQPVTQAEIEAIRGVATDSVLKTLLDRRLIAEVGRKATMGRPILYGTTPEFLHYFALNDLRELPPMEEQKT